MKKRVLGLAVSLIAMGAYAQEELPGYDRFEVDNMQRARPVLASIWYPAGDHIYTMKIGDNAVFDGNPALMGAAVADGKHPLVLLSHGSGGNMDGISWLSSALALKGAIVLGVNHPGTTSGDSSPRRTFDVTKRGSDLRAALDQILADPDLSRYIDKSQISVIGFSLGGATALNLGGVQFDSDKFAEDFKDYCGANPDETGCSFFIAGGVDVDHLPEGFSGDGRDPRIGAMVAIDPGYVTGVDEASLADIEIPSLLINLSNDNTLHLTDMDEGASGFAAMLPNSTYVKIDPAWHFSFLAECKPAGEAILAEEGDDPVCSDPEGAVRSEIHAEITSDVAEFLKLEN